MNVGSAPSGVYADSQHHGPVPAASVAAIGAITLPGTTSVTRPDPAAEIAAAAMTHPDPNRLDPHQPHPAHRAAEHRAATATETLEALRTAKREAEVARLHATQKIADLKAQLHLVEMLHVGDPAKRGEAAEQIARELAATVHDYINAGGTMIPSSAPVPVAGDETSAPTDTVNAVAATATAPAQIEATRASDPAVLVAAAAVGGAIHADIATAQAPAPAPAPRRPARRRQASGSGCVTRPASAAIRRAAAAPVS
ncbi:hypothetical protein [Sphingomonas sp. CV7422]|uniref:hypothetical protein n=1 Tax=Sphingomonas sp. CV7422 TaxID=3018036 RepID=UPI0022FDFC6D|nr:hypothetical protein [Sphingomonas sp. CV7422]